MTEPVILALITMLGGVIVESIRSGVVAHRDMKTLKESMARLCSRIEDIEKKLRDYGF